MLTEDLFHAVEQFLGAERLGDVIIHLGDVDAQHAVDVLGLGGDDDNGDVAGFFVRFHLLVYFPPVHIGHHQVKQDQVGQFFTNQPETFLPARGPFNVKAAPPQDQTDKIDHFLFVFHT